MARVSTAIALRRSLASRPRRPAPIVIRTTKIEKAKHRRRHGHGKTKIRVGVMAAGFALGLIDKSGMNIPTLPYIGRAGTLAVAAYIGERFLGLGQWASDATVGFGTVALYELGKEGSISGEEYIAGDF